jgi:hypothetical protein
MSLPKRSLVIAFVIAVVTLVAATTAQAVQITRHLTYRDPQTHQVWFHIKYNVDLKPTDSDQDGTADTSDGCPHTAGPTSNGGCPIPAPAPVTVSTATSSSYSGGSCPASLAGESTSPTAVNPSSGASGCIQALPSTWDQYGDPAYAEASDAPVSVQMQALQAICAAQGNDAWVAADPC